MSSIVAAKEPPKSAEDPPPPPFPEEREERRGRLELDPVPCLFRADFRWEVAKVAVDLLRLHVPIKLHEHRISRIAVVGLRGLDVEEEPTPPAPRPLRAEVYRIVREVGRQLPSRIPVQLLHHNPGQEQLVL